MVPFIFYNYEQEVFKLVFDGVERIYTELLSGFDSSNEDLVAMAQLDAAKLCSTAEGLKNSPIKLKVIESSIAVMKELATKKEDVPQPEGSNMTIEEGSDEEKEKEKGIETSTETVTETPTETATVSETKTEAETEAETETEVEAEAKTETDSKTETETETKSDT